MSPRSKSFDVNDALSRAVDVFWEQGYEGASMQDLLERMGISRQSLYDTFGDKRRLFLSSLQYYMDEYASMVYSELEAPGASMDAIRNFAQHAIESADSQVAHRACLMVNTVMEFGRKDEDVAAMVQAHQRQRETLRH